ncbi:hypothetical protein GO009_06010 [Muricauda sp. TY007]|uniref:hypothetical protein n=1 Tax=Allomuricauda sp. TY007 TaxID=2683200 RepID=UPI0013C27971|nr:hypothetical protein [Muricauda sp. TY007]NDV15576.1 hypothetical protein [Muricauda sp. TY007]
MSKLIGLSMELQRKQYPTIPEHARPKPKYTDKTSNGLTKCIIDWINFNGYQAERINSMGRPLDTRKSVKDVLGRTRTVGSIKWVKGQSQNGTADISATIKGRSVKIEVKCQGSGDRYQSQAQKEYQKSIEKAGGVYIIARTFQGFMNWYDRFVNARI